MKVAFNRTCSWRFEDLPRRIAFNKVLRDKAFSFAKNLKYDGYQRSLASMNYNFLDKNLSTRSVKSEILANQN